MGGFATLAPPVTKTYCAKRVNKSKIIGEKKKKKKKKKIMNRNAAENQIISLSFTVVQLIRALNSVGFPHNILIMD